MIKTVDDDILAGGDEVIDYSKIFLTTKSLMSCYVQCLSLCCERESVLCTLTVSTLINSQYRKYIRNFSPSQQANFGP